MAALLRKAAHGVPVELVHVSTIGDRDLSGPLRNLGSFGIFTREVQKVVLEGHADIAVHSLKDLPTEPVEGLSLAGVPARGSIADALVLPQTAGALSQTADGVWESLPQKARVGTGSLRRRAQLLHDRPDLELEEVRGNVETRLRKLDDGEYDALVLAVAGLERLGHAQRITRRLDPPILYPAVGQGALGLECRSDDDALREILHSLTDIPTECAVLAERALLADLRAGCQAPLGVWTRLENQRLSLEAVVLSRNGKTRIIASGSGSPTGPEDLGRQVAEKLRQQGADELIAAARS